MKVCPRCNKVISYNSHFGKYLCDCGYEYNSEESLMNHKDAVKWLESLKKAISQSQFSSLWNFEEPLDKIIEMLESECGR